MIEGQLFLIEKHNLGNMVAWLLEHNQSQAAPYHNFSHCMDVMYLAQHAYCYEQERPYEKAICIAALFHDCNHSMGFYSDDNLNTYNALEALKLARCQLKMNHTDKQEDNMFFVVRRLIENLQWPHEPLEEYSACINGRVCEKQYNIAANCLRDADLFQFCITTINSIVGIKKESFSQMTWDTFLMKHIAFMENIEYHSVWGKTHAHVKRDATVRHLQQLRKLCYLSHENIINSI